MERPPSEKLLGKGHHLLGVVLAAGFFVFMSIILRPFTFSPDPLVAQVQACIAALPVSCVFWFACNMFMVVLADQRKRKAGGSTGGTATD